jgi:hypothetical protein
VSLTDYAWLTFFTIGIIAGLLIAIDECIEAHKRAKSADPEDWNP